MKLLIKILALLSLGFALFEIARLGFFLMNQPSDLAVFGGMACFFLLAAFATCNAASTISKLLKGSSK